MVKDLKTLGKHTLIYGSGMFLGKALGFLLIPVYTRYLTPKDYGILELLDLTGYFLGYLFGLGIEQGMLKFYGQYDESQAKNEVLSSAIMFSLLVGGLLVFLLLPLSPHFSLYILGSSDHADLFTLLFISLLLGAVLQTGKTILRAQHRSVMYTTISIVSAIAAGALNVYFVAGLQWGVVGMLYSTLICSLVFSFYLIYEIVKDTGLQVRWLQIKQMLAFGMPFVPAGILAFIMSWSDRYILNIFSTMEKIGLYALGYKMGMIMVMLIAAPFMAIWNAYVFEIEKRHDAKRVYATIATYFMLAMTFGGLMLSLFSRELMAVMAPQAYQDAALVIPIIAAASVFKCADNVFQVGLLIKGKSVYIPISLGIAACVGVLFNLLLIPRYDMVGAAIATLLSLVVWCVVTIRFSQRVYPIEFEYRRLGMIAASALMTFGITVFIATNSIWASIVLKVGALALFPLLLIAFGFLNPEESLVLKQWRRHIQSYV